MTFGLNWCTVAEAVSKYNLPESLILKWVSQGVVRAEEADHKVVRVNVDDLELEVLERGAIGKE